MDDGRHTLEKFESLAEQGIAWEVIGVLPHGVAIVDKNGRFQYANPAFGRLVGRPPKTLLGKAALDVIHPEDAERFIRARLQASQGPPSAFELRLLRQDGVVVHADLTSASFLQEGELAGVISVTPDLAARKGAEEHDRLLAEHATDLISVHDAQGVYRYASPASRALLGYEPEELLGRSAYEFFHPEDLAAIEKSHATILEVPAVYTVAYRIRHKDGHHIWFETTSKTVRNPDTGQFLEIIAVSRDISQRMVTEQHRQELLAATQRQTRELALLEKVREAIAGELELSTIFRTVVEAIAEAFGYTLVSLYRLEGDRLVLQHQVGYKTVIREIPITAGVSGRVARGGEPVLLKDVTADPDFLGAIEGIVSEVCVPLFDQNTVAGTLNVESIRGQTLNEDDVRLLMALSESISIAIYRARLFSEVRQSRRRLQTVISNAPVILWAIDRQGRFTLAEGKGLEGLGPEGQLVGLSLVDTFGPLIPQLDEYFQNALSGEETQTTITLAGTTLEVRYAPLRNERGEVSGLSGIALDITDRVKREQELESFATVTRALRQAKTRAQMLPIILEQAIDLLHAGGALYAVRSQAGEVIIKLGRGDWQPLTGLKQSLPEEGVTDFSAESGEVYISDDIRNTLRWRHLDRLRPHFAMMGAPVMNDNQVAGVIWLGRTQPFSAAEVQSMSTIAEITAAALSHAHLLETLEQQVEERTRELALANASLQELDQLKTKFIDDVSHELRTPAAAITLSLDLFARGGERALKKHLPGLQQHSNRLNEIIKSILQFSDMAELTAAQSPTTLNLHTIVVAVAKKYRPKAKAAGLNLILAPANKPLAVWGIAGLLPLAIGYLLDNAVKYTRHGSITVSTAENTGKQLACVQIADTGMGIEPEELDHVFERFYRGRRVSQLTTPGAGLGLAMVQQIVGQHGGQIAIESEVGVGTTVYLWLPLAPKETENRKM